MHRRVIAALVGLLLLIPVAWAEDAGLARRLDGIVDYAIAENHVVGTVVLVARQGKLVYHRAAGYADREAGVRMREDTIFRLASMTKPMVSAAALALVDAGKLGLDDPVTRWIPEFRPHLADGTQPAITIRHLLTHTSGLTYTFMEDADGPYHRAGVSDGLEQSVLSIDDNLRRIGSAPLLFAPGSAWGYSLATDVLGEVVARAGGAPLPEIVRRTITDRLGMADTGFTPSDRARLAVAYADSLPRPQRMTEPHALVFGTSTVVYSPAQILDNKAYPSGGAGMVGTAGDYLKFLEVLRRGGEPILRPETARAMTSHAIGEIKVPLGGGDGWGFGLGVGVLTNPQAVNNPSAAGTWFWGGVYGTHFWVDPQAGLTVIVLTNTAVAGMGGPYPEFLRRAIYATP